MKEYGFEYTNQSSVLKLMGVCFSLFFGLFFMFIYAKDFINVGATSAIITSITIPIIVFWLFKKKCNLSGTASLNETFVELKLNEIFEKINFQDIESYKIEDVHNGIVLKIHFNDKRKLKIVANDHFSNSVNLGKFSNDLAESLEKFKVVNHSSLSRIKSMYESKFFLVYLIIISLTFIVALFYSFKIGKIHPVIVLSSTPMIAFLWAQYYRIKKKYGNTLKKKTEP
ncbi:MAG: hypothetical protein ACHQHP_03385 [Bacteroidia bacterium]